MQTKEVKTLQNKINKLNIDNNKQSANSKFISQDTFGGGSNSNFITTNKRVNLRDAPKIPSKIKFIIDTDKKLRLIKESDNWVEVSTASNVKGFIFKKYINFDINSASTANPIPKSNSKDTNSSLLLTVKVYSNLTNGDKLSVNRDSNLREIANGTSNIVNIIKKGEIYYYFSLFKQ